VFKYDSQMRFAMGILVSAVLLVPVSGISAEHGEQPLAQAGVTMDQAIDGAQRRYKARVVRADVSEANGRRVYVLRLLSEEGRVWTIKVDAETGGEI
jgi:uncharacterized membrane protein YkoI